MIHWRFHMQRERKTRVSRTQSQLSDAQIRAAVRRQDVALLRKVAQDVASQDGHRGMLDLFYRIVDSTQDYLTISSAWEGVGGWYK